MSKQEKWVLIDKRKFKNKPLECAQLIGNMTKLFKMVKIKKKSWDGKKVVLAPITYNHFRKLLGEKKEYNDDNYIIKKLEILTSKRKP